jgi:hypothetical protein
MGARGPVPYSVDRIRLTGNVRPSVHGRRAPSLRMTAEPVGAPPSNLGPEEQILWRKLVDNAHWLTQLDRPLLVAYVTSVVHHQKMVAELAALSCADEDALDIQQLRVRRAFLNMLEAGRALALPPTARLRLTSELPDELDTAEFGAFTVVKGDRT